MKLRARNRKKSFSIHITDLSTIPISVLIGSRLRKLTDLGDSTLMALTVMDIYNTRPIYYLVTSKDGTMRTHSLESSIESALSSQLKPSGFLDKHTVKTTNIDMIRYYGCTLITEEIDGTATVRNDYYTKALIRNRRRK